MRRLLDVYRLETSLLLVIRLSLDFRFRELELSMSFSYLISGVLVGVFTGYLFGMSRRAIQPFKMSLKFSFFTGLLGIGADTVRNYRECYEYHHGRIDVPIPSESESISKLE